MARHQWTFARVGGFDQVEIETGRDLVSLGKLDQKLWVALACPATGIEFDARTLALVDTDHDGRVRATEMIAAVEWADKMLRDPESLTEASDAIALGAIDASHAEGKLWLQTARALLDSLGKSGAKTFSVADAELAQDVFAKRRFNGDRVVTVASADDDATKRILEDALKCTEAATDKSGGPGVTATTTKVFFDEVAAHAAWLAAGDEPATRPLGDATAAAFEALRAVRPKIDDYFARCRIAAYDPRALGAVNREEGDYVAVGTRELDIGAADMQSFPLAQVAADKPLPIERGINPAFRAAMAKFRTEFLERIGAAKPAIADAEWSEMRGRLDGYESWLDKKQGVSVEKLGAGRVRELASGDARATIDALLALEHDAEPLAQSIESVERLVRYHRDLLSLANNFVSFKGFYARTGPATFQVGTLYLDTRSCELCVRVSDAAKHATMAPLANTYLLYCDCRNSMGETMHIAAAMTAGDVDNLMVGRNGVFYDRKGKDWDATVTKIVDNPISVRQAFWSPYKKVLRLIEEQIAKRATDAQTASDARMTAAATETAAAATAGAHPPPAATAPAHAATPAAPGLPRRIDIGVVAALGVAVGGIAAAVGAFLSALFGLGIWMPVGFVGLILAISCPSMAIAWLKLRKRTLGPILDANGWAVNAQAKINVPFGESLTRRATLPDGARRTMTDPFAEKRRPWAIYAIIVVVVGLAGGWYLGKLDRFLPRSARSTTVLGARAPAAQPPRTPASAPAPHVRTSSGTPPMRFGYAPWQSSQYCTRWLRPRQYSGGNVWPFGMCDA